MVRVDTACVRNWAKGAGFRGTWWRERCGEYPSGSISRMDIGHKEERKRVGIWHSLHKHAFDEIQVRRLNIDQVTRTIALGDEHTTGNVQICRTM